MRKISLTIALIAMTISIISIMSASDEAYTSTITIGETSLVSGTDSGNSQFLNAFKYNLSQAATIQSLSFYVVTASGKMRMGIYADSCGFPGTLKGTTAEFTPVAGWNTQPVTSQVQLAAGYYWLAFQPDNDTLVNKRDEVSGTNRCSYPRTYGALPSTFQSGDVVKARASFYATLSLSTYVKKVNCGGSAVDGLEADQEYTTGGWGYSGGMPYLTVDTVSPDFGYPSGMKEERYGNNAASFSYKFTVPNGNYMVKLYMAELYCKAPGKRTFHVDIEGQRKLTDYDVYAASGGRNKGVENKFYCSVSDGILEITFTKSLGDGVIQAIVVASNPPLTNAVNHQTIPTYDDSGQNTHPSVVYFADGWCGYNYWMAMTPYPDSNDAYENPSIVASNDGVSWIVPSGVTNPLTPWPGQGHNCDCDLLYNPVTNQLWIYYVEANDVDTSYLYVLKSSDGVNWTSKQLVFSMPGYEILGHTIVYNQTDNKFYLWYVDADNCKAIRYRTSNDGMTWSAQSNVNLTQTGYYPWHLEVEYIPSKSEYWMVFCASTCRERTYKNTKLFYAKSTDRINWTTYNTMILDTVSGTWQRSAIYRSAFMYDAGANKIKVWYSAQGGNSERSWYTGYTENDYTSFINALNN